MVYNKINLNGSFGYVSSTNAATPLLTNKERKNALNKSIN